MPGRAERAGDEPVGARAFARQLGGAEIDLAHLADQRPLGEPQRRRAERAREDDVGTRLDERAVELDDALGRLEQPLLGREPGLHAHRLVVRPGRPVGDQHAVARPADL